MQAESTITKGNSGIHRVNATFISCFHIGSVAALFFPSWQGLIAAVFFYWLAGSLGIGMGYHRLLTHRSFKTPKWFEYVLTICGMLALQDGHDQLGGDAPHPSPAHGSPRQDRHARAKAVVAHIGWS